MKVLHINASETGSTGKIIADISRNLHSLGHNFVLCAPKIVDTSTEYLKKYAVSLPFEQGAYRRLSYFTGIPYGFAPLSTHKVISIIKNEQPDIVHLHSINSNVVNVYSLLKYLKKHHMPTVITNHAEFLYTGSCPHARGCYKWKTECGECPSLKYATGSIFFDRTHTAWRKMKKAFDGFDNLAIVNVSPWVTSRAKESPILSQYNHSTILNGINVEVFCNKPVEKTTAGEKIIFHVTSMFSDAENHIKGGKYFIELARRLQNDNIKLVVAGPHNVQCALPDNIILLGKLSNQNELADWYRKADLTVLTSKSETFGMAVAESLCCGTPVVGFCSGGSESVTIDAFSEFVEFGNVDKLEEIVRSKWLDFKSNNESELISETSISKYESKIMAEEYLDVYSSLLSSSNN